MLSSWAGKIREVAAAGQGEFLANIKKLYASSGCNTIMLQNLFVHKAA
jgi:hypothetical protein